MKETKNEKFISSSNYTSSEEKMNMISHIVGTALGLVALIVCIILATNNNNIIGIVSSIIYSLSIIVLYACSSYYHGLKIKEYKRIFRVLDHCSIFLLIAGTYTVISLSGITPLYPIVGWLVFGFVWGLAIIGIVLNAINIEKFKVISLILNVVIGWFVMPFSKQLIESISLDGFMLILFGGICYTIGAVIYAVGKKKKYFHFVFHLLCLAGTILHFLSVAFYCL